MKAGVENSTICTKMWCNEGWYKMNDDTFLYMSINEFLQKKCFSLDLLMLTIQVTFALRSDKIKHQQ